MAPPHAVIVALALIAAQVPQAPAPIAVHRLVNRRGMAVELIDRGATIARITVPDAKGRPVDVLVSPPPEALVAGERRYASIVGRYAGRLRGSVSVAGTRYPLAVNAAGVTLHGGDPGLDRATWTPRRIETRDATGIAFTHVSPDGSQGFPGRLTITARYTLKRAANVLRLDISAVSDRATVLNLTNHGYFDLSGGLDLGGQTLKVDAPRSVALDARKLPTGSLPDVTGTSMDFRHGRSLASVVADGGVDAMLVFGPVRRAVLHDRASGRTMTLTTNQPGLQVYTGNGFDGTAHDRRGRAIARFSGIALEAANLPDAPNVPGFPSALLVPGQTYRWWTQWQFSTGSPAGR